MDAATVRLAVDGGRVNEVTDRGTAARLLDVSSARLYVGGVGVDALAAAVDARLTSLLPSAPDQVEVAGSLRGACIRNFKVRLAPVYLLSVYLSWHFTTPPTPTRISSRESSPTSPTRAIS